MRRTGQRSQVWIGCNGKPAVSAEIINVIAAVRDGATAVASGAIFRSIGNNAVGNGQCTNCGRISENCAAATRAISAFRYRVTRKSCIINGGCTIGIKSATRRITVAICGFCQRVA